MKRKLLITCKWVLFVVCSALLLNGLSMVGAILAIIIVRPFMDYDPDYEIVILYAQIIVVSAIVYYFVLDPLYVRTKIKINKLVEKS